MSDLAYCTFQLAGDLFGVEVGRVQEVIREQPFTPVPLAPPHVAGLLNLRGQIVPAIDLRRRLGIPDSTGSPRTNVLVLDAEGPISLLVDEVGEVTNVTHDSFEECPDTLRTAAREFLRGVHKLTNGLLLVLDLDRVLDPVGGARV